MFSFKDDLGREWTLNLTLGTFMRIRSERGIDLLNLSRVHKGAEGDEWEGVPLATRLQLDLPLLCDVLFAIVEPQAKSSSISAAEFAESLSAPRLAEAQLALNRALLDFFRQAPNHGAMAKAIEKTAAMVETIITEAIARIEKISIGSASPSSSPG